MKNENKEKNERKFRTNMTYVINKKMQSYLESC